MINSDSSDDEDLARFKDVVDTSFIVSLNAPAKILPEQKLHSERYLEISSHYNDVKVPDKLQRQIGDKISGILSKMIEYVNVLPSNHDNNMKEHNIEGGVKLFRDSEGLLSCAEINDIKTKFHNNMSKKLKAQPKKRLLLETDETSVTEKINLAAVSGQVISSRQETKYWKSRRKQKVYKYTTKGKSKVLIAID